MLFWNNFHLFNFLLKKKDQSKEVAEFVTVAKWKKKLFFIILNFLIYFYFLKNRTATAALLKPIGFAKECFANASQVFHF